MDDVTIYAAAKFLSTPSARRATWQLLRLPDHRSISIHALREEGDHRLRPFNALRFLFLSTPSARRATFGVHPVASLVGISIHALREEGDAGGFSAPSTNILFLSTPSARRATAVGKETLDTYSDFYPRPPRGGRLQDFTEAPQTLAISIHALREEGDGADYANEKTGQHISIHALREEGDACASV